MTCVITQRLRDTKGPRLALNVPLFPETALPFDTLAGRCRGARGSVQADE